MLQYNSIQEAKECWFDLDKEEKYWILNELGEPPYSSYNIYIITIYDNLHEKIVYIGKTDSKESRFKNGHKAALRLHHPKYNNYNKRVYFGTITFVTKENEYLPIEFITPLEKAKEYLGYYEARLIDYFKPELNRKIEKQGEFIGNPIHIKNFSGVSNFLHDYFII